MPCYRCGEYRVQRIREVPPQGKCETPAQADTYWREHIATAPTHNPDVECLAVLMLNARSRIKGHAVISIGALNEVMAHPREIFRPCIVAAAWGFILMHNHPSGDPSPSDADRRLTHRITEAARLLQITFLDHIIIGTATECPHAKGYFSHREAGIL